MKKMIFYLILAGFLVFSLIYEKVKNVYRNRKYYCGILFSRDRTQRLKQKLFKELKSMEGHVLFTKVLYLSKEDWDDLIILAKNCIVWGREPPNAMSLRYADTSLPNFLSRPGLHYAVQASAMQTVPPLCTKRAFIIKHICFNSWVLCVIKNFNNFFLK